MPIENTMRPRRNRISIPVPMEYASYSFNAVAVPIEGEPGRTERAEYVRGWRARHDEMGGGEQ